MKVENSFTFNTSQGALFCLVFRKKLLFLVGKF